MDIKIIYDDDEVEIIEKCDNRIIVDILLCRIYGIQELDMEVE